MPRPPANVVPILGGIIRWAGPVPVRSLTPSHSGSLWLTLSHSLLILTLWLDRTSDRMDSAFRGCGFRVITVVGGWCCVRWGLVLGYPGHGGRTVGERWENGGRVGVLVILQKSGAGRAVVGVGAPIKSGGW